jgi:hypothetical protein
MKLSFIFICSLLFFSFIYAQNEVVRKEKDLTVYLDRTSAVKTYIYSNGKKLQIDLRGKTPYGIQIDKILKLIQSSPVSVEMVFSDTDSDEIMNEDVRYLFDNLYNSLKSVAGGKRYEGSDELKIVVSYCRFGEYGYCYNKDHALSVRFIEKNKLIKEYYLNGAFLKDKKKGIVFVDKIAKDFQSM